MTSTPAEQAVHALRRLGLTVATAESLTGGGVGDALTSVPGASTVYAGGVVTYSTRLKVELLGVPAHLVERHGVVSPECAAAMADLVRSRVGADVGVATTGVAGPDPQEGKPVGLVYVAVADASAVEVEELSLTGDRAQIRRATVAAVLELLVRRLSGRTEAAATEETRPSGGNPGREVEEAG